MNHKYKDKEHWSMGEQRTRDFNVPLTLEEFKQDMVESNGSKYFAIHHQCGKCGLPLGWDVDGDDVFFEDACLCRDVVLRRSSMKSMYTNLISQRIKEDYERTLKGYGLYEAYRKDT